jgi:hypothetical protein
VRAAIASLAAAAACILAGAVAIAATWGIGLWHGLYCSLGNATTAGCDASPHSTAGRLAGMAVWLTAIPLLANAFSHIHLHRHRKMQAKTESGAR